MYLVVIMALSALLAILKAAESSPTLVTIDYKEMTRAVQSSGVNDVLLSVLLSEPGGREVRAQRQWSSGDREHRAFLYSSGLWTNDISPTQELVRVVESQTSPHNAASESACQQVIHGIAQHIKVWEALVWIPVFRRLTVKEETIIRQ